MKNHTKNATNCSKKYYESKIQSDFISHVKKTYPKLRLLVYHIPNGGDIGGKKGAILASMGTLSGVADINVDVSHNGFGSLKIEFKTKDGIQSKEQKDWQEAIEKAGHKYVLVRSVDDALKEMLDYLKGSDYIV